MALITGSMRRLLGQAWRSCRGKLVRGGIVLVVRRRHGKGGRAESLCGVSEHGLEGSGMGSGPGEKGSWKANTAGVKATKP